MIQNKIGVALITCDRPAMLGESLQSIIITKDNYDEFIVVNDGKSAIEFDSINNDPPYQGVGVSKSKALRYLYEKDCEHIFLIEDDITIDAGVFQAYINASKATGIKHLNFGLHGNHNKDARGNPVIRKTVEYPDGTKIDLYNNVLGAFSYYHRYVIEDCGFMNELYFNGLEHVSHTLEIAEKGYTSPFRWFADIHDSEKYIKDIDKNHEGSKIRNEKDFHEQFKKNLDIFITQHGFSVVGGYGPPEKFYTEEETIKQLKQIYNESR
jgi:glycosyltransferase involved in cell wall biosynthesis